jgi:hypothetical protein
MNADERRWETEGMTRRGNTRWSARSLPALAERLTVVATAGLCGMLYSHIVRMRSVTALLEISPTVAGISGDVTTILNIGYGPSLKLSSLV